ncbi:MAG TPA: DUF2243 domain-containing protein [Gemmatimonadaceae bacterium]|nr:DUF2243 domain-containing protein [Gemmatimonadaceae bacterium]
MPASSAPPRDRISVWPGLVLGLGVGGFVDGIALHQIAQWHNMGSAVLPPTTMDAMRRNMAWDGWFHAATLTLTVAGLYLLLRDARAGARLPGAGAFTGQLLLGWGIFNLVEGLIDHHVLELHHVRDLPVHVPLYDWLFLGLGGVGLIVVGWLLARPGRDTAAPAVRAADSR